MTGGTYDLTGTLQFNGATIVTNAANITLTGTSSQIVDQNGNNGLANFATNTSSGSLTLAGNRNLTSAGSFSNAGTMKVSKGSTLTVGGNGSYMQSAGQTTVDGTLATTAPGAITIPGGSVFGNGGALSGNITSSGTFNIGDKALTAGTESMAGTYTQTSTGVLDIDIGGTTAKTQFDQLNISSAASLNGTLNLDLINSFVPKVGETFDILNAGSVAGMFVTVNGEAINTTEHFTVMYNSNNVTLDVASGPAAPGGFSRTGPSSATTPEPSTILLLGSGLLVTARYARRKPAAKASRSHPRLRVASFDELAARSYRRAAGGQEVRSGAGCLLAFRLYD